MKEKMMTNNYLDNLLISDIFKENSFNIFLEYCAKNNMVYFYELHNFDFEKLIDIRGLGKAKIIAILERYYTILNGENEVIHTLGSGYIVASKIDKEYFSGENFINTDLFDLKVEILNFFKIKEKVILKLKENGIITLRDLSKTNKKSLMSLLGRVNFERLEQNINIFKLDFKNLFEFYVSEIYDDRDYNIVFERAQKNTLQNIADMYGITRERVRQLINRSLSKIDVFMDVLTKKIKGKNNYFKVQEIKELLESENLHLIVELWCKNSDDFEYLDFAEICIDKIENTSNENIIKDLVLEYIGSGIDVYENIESIESFMAENGFDFIDASMFIDIAKKYGCNLYGDYIAPIKLGYSVLVERLVYKYFPEGVKLYDDEEFERIKSYIHKEYGDLEYSNDTRGFSTRIAYKLVLRGRGRYISPRSLEININDLEKIKEYIDNSEDKIVYYSALFDIFKDTICKENNIDNYNFLHGIIAFYYPNSYGFSRDYLIKEGDVLKSGKFEEKIKEIILSERKPVHKNILREKLSIVSDIIITNILNKDEDLFLWGFNHIASLALFDIDDDDKNYLENAMDMLLENNYGYATDNMLYKKVKEENYGIIEKFGIKNSSNLYYLCSKIFVDKFDFRKPNIAVKNKFSDISTSSIVLDLLKNKEKFNFNFLSDIFERFMILDCTKTTIFNKIEDVFIRISADEYIKKDDFVLSDTQIESIRSVILDNMVEGVLSLPKFSNWGQFTDIGLDWNAFLLNSIVKEHINDLKEINTLATDRRYMRAQIINKSLPVNNFEDLVIYLLKKEGVYKISEKNMLLFVSSKLLSGSYIPRELYSSKKICYNHGFFEIQKNIEN